MNTENLERGDEYQLVKDITGEFNLYHETTLLGGTCLKYIGQQGTSFVFTVCNDRLHPEFIYLTKEHVYELEELGSLNSNGLIWTTSVGTVLSLIALVLTYVYVHGILGQIVMISLGLLILFFGVGAIYWLYNLPNAKSQKALSN